MSSELNVGSTLEESQKLVISWHKRWAELLVNQTTEKALSIAVEALDTVRSELNSPKPDDHWCIDQICQALAKIAQLKRGG